MKRGLYFILIAMFTIHQKLLVRSFVRPAARQLANNHGWSRKTSKFFSSVASAVQPTIEKVFQTIRHPSVTGEFKFKENDDETIKQIAEHLQSYFLQGQRLPLELITDILNQSTARNKQLPNVLQVSRPFLSSNPANRGNLTVCGDTHGQFNDFCEIFSENIGGGFPSATNTFLFNGDIADRGDKALEIFMFLLIVKLIQPNSVHILRGNHETMAMTNVFGFKNEIKRKYGGTNGIDLLNHFYNYFNSLPVAAVLEETVFVTHGGLGPQVFNKKIQDLNELNRFEETNSDGPLGELLWCGK